MTLTLRNISKRFGSLLALDDVSLELASGEVHALLGENGAGKTTLMNVAYGIIRPDAGEIVDTRGGTPVSRTGYASPAEARAAGIGMVHQHFTSIAALSVGENIALAAGWHQTGRAAERRATALIARFNLPIDATAEVASLSVQLRQRLEIVKALAADARTLLLDEPSAVLAPREIGELLQVVKDFARAGGAVVLITHKLDEVFQAADRVTVLRRGRVTFSGRVAGETPQSLARAMLGADVPRDPPHRSTPGAVLVRATDLTLTERGSTRTAPRITSASFEWRAGEIVGVAAIEGNGQRELLRTVAGLDEARVASGALEVTRPIAFVAEDRTIEGVIPSFSATENVLLGTLDSAPQWLNWDGLRARTRRLIAAFDIRADGPDVAVATLSGGNQQKLILARALERQPKVVVAENPTRGLDVQATHAIHARLVAAAKGGALVIVHSSDLDEVLVLADRLVVIANGEVFEMPANASRDDVGDAMLGLASTR